MLCFEPVALDQRRIDLVHQYALVVAAFEDDWRSRELGPIHLVKYAYLADLAYARRHGEGFTGAAWEFHHFGPWQTHVFERIEPSLLAIQCTRTVVSNSRYQDDVVRFTVQHDVTRLREQLEELLPIGVSGAIQTAVHRFGSDTASLLPHVYLTAPMLYAAPGELLDLTRQNADRVSEAAPTDQFTAKQTKERKQLVAQLKQKVQERLRSDARGRESAPHAEPPRYDDLFVAGTEWLDVLAGEPPQPLEGEVVADAFFGPSSPIPR